MAMVQLTLLISRSWHLIGQDNMKIFIKIFLIATFVFFAPHVFAGSISISKILPATNDLKIGDEILIEVGLSSQGTEYNAAEGLLVVPEIFEVQGVVTGNSFISVWLENPADFKENQIRFSGITPAGYNQEKGLVFSVVLKAREAGFGNLELQNTGLFQNDGLGTRENVREQTFPLYVRNPKDGETPYLVSIKDETPPEEFTIEILRDPNLFDGKRTLVWSALDKGSGIASYDVFEGRNVFKHVGSPYVLENQRLSGKIKVIAYDHEGNTREASVNPPGKVCFGYSCFGLAHAFIVLALITVFFILWRKHKK